MRAKRAELDFLNSRRLFVDDGGAGGAGGGAPASPAAPAAAPEASSVIGAGTAQAAQEPAKSAEPAKQAEPVKAEPAKAEAPKVSADDQRKYLVEKGAKAEDLTKLSDADLQKQYDDAKTKEGQPAAVKPDDIKVTVPEGIEIDEKKLGEFKALIADATLTPQDRAQKLIDLHASLVKGASDALFKGWADTQKGWQEAVKADTELGGQNYDAVRSTISKALTEIGGTEAKAIEDAFKLTGAGNNPAIVRFVYRMSKLVTEGGPVGGKPPSDAKGFAQRLQAMYPSATQGAA